jgi:tRNA(Leu) C34 or U34 (ribose-2'-O)-methylase TrmL
LAAKRAGFLKISCARTGQLPQIPMLNPRVRSLNLATAVGIVLFEALSN